MACTWGSCGSGQPRRHFLWTCILKQQLGTLLPLLCRHSWILRVSIAATYCQDKHSHPPCPQLLTVLARRPALGGRYPRGRLLPSTASGARHTYMPGPASQATMYRLALRGAKLFQVLHAVYLYETGPCDHIVKCTLTCVYLCILVYACVYPRISVYTCVYICILVCILVYTCVHLCIPLYICVYPLVYPRILVYTCVYSYIPMYISVCMCIHRYTWVA